MLRLPCGTILSILSLSLSLSVSVEILAFCGRQLWSASGNCTADSLRRWTKGFKGTMSTKCVTACQPWSKRHAQALEMAVAMTWGSLLQVCSKQELYYSRPVVGSLMFGNPQIPVNPFEVGWTLSQSIRNLFVRVTGVL